MTDFGWSAAAIAQTRGGAVSAGMFLRVETDPVMRVFVGGIGLYDQVPVSAIEPVAGALYYGLGEVADFPELEAFLNGKAGRLDLTLQGAVVTQPVFALAARDLDLTEGAECNFGLCLFDRELQPMSPVAWLWAGIGSSLSLKKDPQGGVKSITLPVGSLLTGRRRPNGGRWTDASQKARTAGADRSCELLANYNQGTTKQWPVP
jgi:hypothetical protein